MQWFKKWAAHSGSTVPLGLISGFQKQICEAAAREACDLAQEFENSKNGWPKRIEEYHLAISKLQALSSVLTETAERYRSDNKDLDQSKTLQFSASTLFLRECWEYLTSDPSLLERAHLVTGPITPEGVRVLSRMEKIKLDMQSPVYVRAEPKSTHQHIVNLTEVEGHVLFAMFHGHNSKGAGGTKPSQTDYENQDRQRKIGSDAIGGIFSTDGYVRFFSTCTDISVDIYGTGAEQVLSEPREQVFKLPVRRK